MLIKIKIKVYQKKKEIKKREERECNLASLLFILFKYQYKLDKQFYISKKMPIPITRILTNFYQVDKFLW